MLKPVPNVADITVTTDPSANQMLALFHATGKDLLQSRLWPQLKKLTSISTVATQSDYSLPDDFYAPVFTAGYNFNTKMPTIGPITDEQSAFNSLYGNFWGGYNQFQVYGLPGTRQFKVFPTPTVSNQLIIFPYYSNAWVFNYVGTLPPYVDPSIYYGTYATIPQATNVFEDDLMILGIKWRWQRELGLDYNDTKQDYLTRIDQSVNRFNGITTGSFSRYQGGWDNFNLRYRPRLGGWNI